ncbi:MAG TPA: TolC family protein [Verrucomicrobiae bacterium]|nr:TolC family protein [Verrucomicrobiae bacterium]
MKKLGIVSIFFSAAFAVTAQTNTNAAATHKMSLQDCIQEALSHNFDVQVQRINPQISLYNLNAAYEGYDPLFSISGQHNFDVSPSKYSPYSTNGTPASVANENSFNSGLTGTLPWGLEYDFSGNIAEQYGADPGSFDNSSGSIGVTLTQPLLKNFWIDSTRLNIRVAKNRLQYSEQGLREQLITSVTAVANAYYELIYAEQNVAVQTNALELSQTQLDQDKQRVQIGTLAVLSVQQDESQVAQNKANLIAAQSTLDTDQNTLKNLLTDNYSKWHDTDIQPTESLMALPESFDLQESWSRGMTDRPDLLQAKLNVEQDGIQLKYYGNQLLPELDLTGSYGFNGASREFNGTFGQLGQGNAPFYSYGAQMSIPLGNLGPRNQYKATKAELQQVGLQFKQLEQNILVEIDNAVKQAESSYESVQATQQARIYAEEALDAEQKTYRVGKATTFEVLTYQNNLTTARGQEIRALANYEEALANLAAQEGSTLTRYHINLEAK